MITEPRRRALVWLMAALFAVMALFGASPGNAATGISFGATGSQPNVPVSAAGNWHWDTQAYDDPEWVVDEVKTVNYPASVGVWPAMSMGQSVDIATLRGLDIFASTPGKKVAACESQGCVALTQIIQHWIELPEGAPAQDELVIVRYGDPTTPGTGMSARNAGNYEPLLRIRFPGAAPDSPYKTVFVIREYGFFEDTPDPTNWLAEANRWAGFFDIHPKYGNVDPTSPDNLYKQVGNQTFVLVPTKRLPLLAMQYAVADAWKKLTGRSDLLREVERMDAQLRKIIDAGYDRSGYGPGNGLPPQVVEPVVQQDEVSQVAIEPEAVELTESSESFAASNGDEAVQPFTTGGEQNAVQSKVGDEVVVEEIKTEEPVEQVVSEPATEAPVANAPEQEQQTPATPSQDEVGEQSNDKDEATQATSTESAEPVVKKPARKPGDGVKLTVKKAHEAGRPDADKVGASAPSAPSGAAGGSSGSDSSGNDD